MSTMPPLHLVGGFPIITYKRFLGFTFPALVHVGWYLTYLLSTFLSFLSQLKHLWPGRPTHSCLNLWVCAVVQWRHWGLCDFSMWCPIFLPTITLKEVYLHFFSFNNEGLGPRIRPFYYEKMAKSSCYDTSLRCRSTLVITRYDVLFLNDMIE